MICHSKLRQDPEVGIFTNPVSNSVTEMTVFHNDEGNHCTDVMSVFISQVTLYHLLKLFQSDTNAMLGKKTVVSEFYDEMVRFYEGFKSILNCSAFKLLGLFPFYLIRYFKIQQQ